MLGRFKYDFRNRRIARLTGSQWTYTVADQAGRPLSELALVNGTWSKQRDYIWLDGRLLAQVEYVGSSAYTYFAHLDHLGTPRALTNASGQVVWSTSQLPYGEVREATATDPLTGRTVVTNLRLPGQYDERLLGSLGLQGPYHNWNRWYSPGLGRYLELDPIALAGGFNGEFGPDWYGYAGQNPLRYVDPFGLTSYECKKPLDALGGDGQRSGPDAGRNPLYHKYLCTDSACGGKGQRNDWPIGPGVPSRDYLDKKPLHFARR